MGALKLLDLRMWERQGAWARLQRKAPPPPFILCYSAERRVGILWGPSPPISLLEDGFFLVLSESHPESKPFCQGNAPGAKYFQMTPLGKGVSGHLLSPSPARLPRSFPGAEPLHPIALPRSLCHVGRPPSWLLLRQESFYFNGQAQE